MSYKKILAIKFRAFGDTVLLSASLDLLRESFPGAEIHVAVTDVWAPILNRHPGVDRLWPYQRHREKAARAKAIARLGYRLRKERFDCVLNFHASSSSSLLALATGARTRSVHFHGHSDKNRYSTVVVPGKGILKPAIERDLDVLRAIGVKADEGTRIPRIVLSDAEKQSGAEQNRALGLSAPLLLIGLGASRQTKIWPVDRYAELARGWEAQTGGTARALVGPGEEELARAFGASLPVMDIRSTAVMISTASIFVGNDSGPKHLAVALGIPTVTVMGPEDPFEWHPYPKDQHPYLYVPGLSCRKNAAPGMPPWCGLETCVTERHRCMREISVQSVLDECLRRYSRVSKSS